MKELEERYMKNESNFIDYVSEMVRNVECGVLAPEKAFGKIRINHRMYLFKRNKIIEDLKTKKD